jgi:superkiller protein 3
MAIRQLQLAQKDAASAGEASSLLGDIYRSEGSYELALDQYNRALPLAKDELALNLRFKLGTVYEAQGQVRKAIKIYESIRQEEVEFGNLGTRIKQLKATPLFSMRYPSLQMVIFEYGQKEIIALWARGAASHGRNKEEINVSFGQEHNQAGFDFFMKGMFPAAREEFLLATQLDRQFGVALNNLAITLAKEGKFEEARIRLNEALQVEPASAVFYNNLGVVCLLSEKTDLAVKSLEKSFALDGTASALWINLGDLYYLKKEAPKAIELYRKAGQFDPLSDLAGRRLLYKVP